MKVHPIPHDSFETTRSRFIQISHHCSLSWRKTPLCFFSSNLYTFNKKSSSKWNFQTFEWVGENSPNSLCHPWNYKSFFVLTLHHSSVSWEMALLYFFNWNCAWFGQKGPIKVQNFRLSTAHLKFHQICTSDRLTQLKKNRWVMYHGPEEWCKIWRKLIICFKNDKNLVNFDLSTRKS